MTFQDIGVGTKFGDRILLAQELDIRRDRMELKCLLYGNGNNQKGAQTSRSMRDNLYKAAFLRLVKTTGEARESLDKQRLICQCMRCPEMTKDV